MPGPNDPHDHDQHSGFNSGMGWALLNAERLAEQQRAIQAAQTQAILAQAAAAQAAQAAAAAPTAPAALAALSALQDVVAAHTTQLAAHQATLNLIAAALTKPAT